MIAGILLILVSIFLNFETSITGAVISVGQSDLNLAAVVAFLVGVCLIITSRMQITGGLEKALEENDDVVGVLSFVRHGEKDKEGNLTVTEINLKYLSIAILELVLHLGLLSVYIYLLIKFSIFSLS